MNVSSSARYAGELGIHLPEGHHAFSRDPEGDYAGPRAVVVGPLSKDRFTSMEDAIAAARKLSEGKRDAVAIVRDPGKDELRIEKYMVKAWADWSVPDARYRTLDLEGVVTDAALKSAYLWQSLQSQRQVMMEAVVDGTMLIDRVSRYKSTRPDLPGRNPDGRKG